MNEAFLTYLWQHRLLGRLPLKSTDNQLIEVVHPGYINRDAGPDFTQARIKIADTLWVGNVELHIRSSDWNRHGHQHDKKYANLILHLVYESDTELRDQNGYIIPTLELKNVIDHTLANKYEGLLSGKHWVPCESHLAEVDDFTIQNTFHRLLIERLESKTQDILNRLAINKNNWEETCYQLTARNFGLRINAEPFDLLAKSLPHAIIGKHKNSLLQIEALVFGQAGMLAENFKDEYPQQLAKEYDFLRKKYSLTPIEGHLWKFLRLRPPAFPSVRLAQFSGLLYRSVHLFSKMLETEKPQELFKLFEAEASAYWKMHYRFDQIAASKSKKMGRNAIELILINMAAPLLFTYGKQKGDEKCCNRALQLLEAIPAEKNSIISRWESIRYKARNAYESQALLQLKNVYCDKKQCLNCSIGTKILRPMVP